MSYTPEELLVLTTRFEKKAHKLDIKEKLQKPLIYRLIDQLKDAIKIGDEEEIKSLKEQIDDARSKLPHFRYVK